MNTFTFMLVIDWEQKLCKFDVLKTSHSLGLVTRHATLNREWSRSTNLVPCYVQYDQREAEIWVSRQHHSVLLALSLSLQRNYMFFISTSELNSPHDL